MALVPYALGSAPSQRYRLEQWAPFLAEHGVAVVYLPFASPSLTALLLEPGHALRKTWMMAAAFVNRLRHIQSLPAHDVVVVHRAACLAGPPFVERFLHSRGLPLVYDFDDAIFRLHTAAANQWFAWLKAPRKTATLCRLSDHVVVGSEYLAGYARRFNDRVSGVPSSVDTDRCRPLIRPANERLVVGWIGSSTSQTYLESELTLLRKLLTTHPMELRVVSSRRPRLPGIPHTWRAWAAERESEDLAGFDIGIMPMPDDDWARGKCAFKALQYMAAGVPTVASAVGANQDVIDHGRNGLLASTDEEWLESIASLADNPSLRQRLGAVGRRTVEERYSMRRSADGFERVLRRVVERCQVSR